MSHLIKIYAVCKFSCFHLWYFKRRALERCYDRVVRDAWLCAESRRNVMSLNWSFAIQQLENSVKPAVNGYLFRITEG